MSEQNLKQKLILNNREYIVHNINFLEEMGLTISESSHLNQEFVTRLTLNILRKQTGRKQPPL